MTTYHEKKCCFCATIFSGLECLTFCVVCFFLFQYYLLLYNNNNNTLLHTGHCHSGRQGSGIARQGPTRSLRLASGRAHGGSHGGTHLGRCHYDATGAMQLVGKYHAPGTTTQSHGIHRTRTWETGNGGSERRGRTSCRNSGSGRSCQSTYRRRVKNYNKIHIR
jgi:hypothetical protein